MTREEAIEALKAKLDYYEHDKRLKAACETLIPELRESEDERIGNVIYCIVRDNKEVKRILEGNGVSVDNALAYLEKQKESLHVSKTCKENADSFTDESERHWKWILEYLYDGLRKSDEQFKDQFKSAITWLEKQKENPKTADSIPSDCALDAKSENRWHKVGDSLPDNGRLVLANDCLGNTLLARYDGENWEVSVYDNEDYYCRNTITKWCEIPSEKQKEQKPIQTSDERGYVRMLKSIVSDFIRDKKPEDVSFYQRVYDWLDGRHIEQKPAELEQLAKLREMTHEIRDVYERGIEVGRVESKQEWSEEDEKRIKQLIYDTEFIKAHYEKRKEELGEQFNDALIRDCDEQIDWLKSLRPDSYKNCNSRWKPSEEQMNWLKSAVRLSNDKPNIHGTIISLYEQLKRLM